MSDWKPHGETVWRGSPSQPMELADELAEAKSRIVRLPYVEPMVVTFTLSVANRDLIVSALRSFSAGERT